MTERLELVIAYKPIDLRPYGLTTIEGTCESAKVRRVSLLGKTSHSDAAENLAGKKFTFQITPAGKIADYSQLNALIRELGKKSFASNTGKARRVKDSDMIFDFVALQWYLWDSVSSIKNPVDGVALGASWKAIQIIPLPIPVPGVRETTYRLDEIMETPTGRKAVIRSSYKLSDERLSNYPAPYTGKFKIKGMFGFLRQYKYQSIEGSGKQIFNIDTSVVESEQQKYQTKISAAFMLPLGETKPSLTVDQKLTVQLLED